MSQSPVKSNSARIIPIGLWLSLFLFSCEKPAALRVNQPVEVTEFVVEAKNLPADFDFVGFAESSHAVEIRARVEGFLDKIAYDEGHLVKKEELLFQLDPRQYQAKVEQAKAEVAKQEAIVANAKLTVERLSPLYQQKAASKKDLDNGIANLLASEASLQSAKAQLLDSEINLSYTTIASPITGLADKAKLREGALVNPSMNSLLTTVSVLDPIWVYFTISDNDILNAEQQMSDKHIFLPKQSAYEVELSFSDGSIFKYKGKVDFSSPTYDQGMGTLLARAVFPNPEGNLRPGQFVRVKVLGAIRPHALFVPQRALMEKKNGMFVYLIDEKNRIIAQDVSTGDWVGEYQVITNGLKTGDRIVVDGINKVFPGVEVKILPIVGLI